MITVSSKQFPWSRTSSSSGYAAEMRHFGVIKTNNNSLLIFTNQIIIIPDDECIPFPHRLVKEFCLIIDLFSLLLNSENVKLKNA